MAGQTAKVEPNEIGWMFVPQYYTFVNKEPGRLHCFYTKKSTFIHGTEGEECPPRYGQQEIHERIMGLEYQDCKVYVSNVDSQSSAEGGIIVQVLGEMSNKGQRWRKFAQTFFLAEQPNGYFVLNDIFRYLKEESDDVEGQDQDDTSVSLGPSAATTDAAAPEMSSGGSMPTLHHHPQQQQAPPPPPPADYGYAQHQMQPYQPMNAFIPPIAQQPAQPFPADNAFNMIPQQPQSQAFGAGASSQPQQQQVFNGQSKANGFHQPGMPEVAVSERSASPPFQNQQQRQQMTAQHEPLRTEAAAFEPAAPAPAEAPASSEPEAAAQQAPSEEPVAAQEATPAPQHEPAPAVQEEEPKPQPSTPAAPSAAPQADPVASPASTSTPALSTVPEPPTPSTSTAPQATPSSPPAVKAAAAPKTTSWANLASRGSAPTNARGVASFAAPLPAPASSGPTPASGKAVQPLQHVPLASSSTQSVLPSIGENRGPGGKPFRNVCDPNRQVTYNLSQVTPNCFLKNILDHVERQDVYQTLTKRFGPIHDVDLMPDKGCGFVEFTTVDQARRACQACLPVSLGGTGYIQLQKSNWPIVVEPKVHKPKTGAGSGSGSANSSSNQQRTKQSSSGASASGNDNSASNSSSKRQGNQSQQGGGSGAGSQGKSKGRQNTSGSGNKSNSSSK